MIKVKTEAWIYLSLLSLIWGSSFILMKKGLEAFPPAQMAALRISIAGVCLLPVALKNVSKLSKKQLLYIGIFGLTNAGLPAFLFAISETVVSSSTAGVLNSLTPIFTLIVGIAAFRQPFSWLKLSGVLLGFAGAAFLVIQGNYGEAIFNTHLVLYASLIVIATFCYGISGNIIKEYLNEIPGTIVSSFSYLIFAIPLIIWLLAGTDFSERVNSNPAAIRSLLYIAILAIIGSAFAIIISVRLVQVSNALFGSFVTYLIPVVSIMWGMVAHESVTAVTWLSLVFILSGIGLASYKKKQVKPQKMEVQESFPANNVN